VGLIGGLIRAGSAYAYPDPERAGFVAVRGGQVWYRINGMPHVVEGKLPLLVIHGGPAFPTTTCWRLPLWPTTGR
jgi:pimeloyl-ACP methyl ester carboxylesterase